jgi:hypothetical protein
MGNRHFAVTAVTLLGLLGCASTGENLQRETARFLGGNVAPEQVQVFDVVRGAASVRWRAVAPGGRLDCSADDMVRRVHCTKQGK